MSSDETKEYCLGDLVEVSQGLAINSKSKHLLVNEGLPLLRITDMFSDTYSQFISVEDAPIKCVAKRDDLIYTRTGQVGFVFTNKQGVIHNNCFKVIPKSPLVTKRFIYWFLRQEKIRALSNSLASGSVQKDLNHSAFKSIPITLIDIHQQKSADELLSALDDRITLLRETNTTLEAIAQALFKSWFVDFDPVHAKHQGRAPEGMDAQTAALFPDSFEESELGMVPKGWRVGAFAELIKLHKGSVNPSAFPSTIFQHYSLPAYDAAQLPVAELGSEIKSNKTSVPIDGVLLSKLNPHIPRVWLPSKVEEYSVCSTEFLPFVPVNGATTALVYTWLSSAGFIAELSQLVTGTSNSHQRIKPDSVLSMQVVTPPQNVMHGFDAVVAPLFEKVKANRLMAYSLSSLRDTLLPRLISGQLRLPEAQAQLESVDV